MKTHTLTGRALDYAVALAEGRADPIYWFAPEPGDQDYIEGEDYSQLFYVGGPDRLGPYTPTLDKRGDDIIDREKIDTEYFRSEELWYASVFLTDEYVQHSGTTRREAAMRAYVASKLGDEIEIPKELM